MSGVAWITTAKGDKNYDGDTDDLTLYDSDHTYTGSAVPYVKTPESGDAGDWERWPGYFNTGGDEGHFYMECSNRGLCDRSTGQCKCFPGYTGEACRRTVCPNDCSGHGTCESVKELAVASGFTYGLWDAEKSMACSCDPGYGGIACSERVCPFGDDPLTKARTSPEKDQADEIQYIDLYSDVGPFSGKIFLKYTDYYGKQWHTDKIGVAVIPSGISNPDYSASDMQTATKAALENLPNNVIGNVDVSVGPCSSVLAGQCDTQGNDLQCDDGSGAATAFGATKVAFHCADDSSNYFIGDNSGDIFEYADKNTNDDFNVNTAATTCFAHTGTCTAPVLRLNSQRSPVTSLTSVSTPVKCLF